MLAGKKQLATRGKMSGALGVHASIAHDLGAQIVSGRFKPGEILVGEIESSEQRNVSRTAYREAMRVLSAKGLVTSRPRVGTRVSPQHDWHLLDPDVLGWIFHGDPDPGMLQNLFELRFMVEPAAAALAAAHRTPSHLDEMRGALALMKQHTLQTPAGRLADQEFHAALLRAGGNPFVISLTNGVIGAVDALTEFKQRGGPLQRDPIPDHELVFDAIVEKNADGARKAMAELIRLAVLDTPIRSRRRQKKH